jgi:predicted permease
MALFRRFANLFRRSHVDREIADELQSHIDLRIESNLAAGMSPEEARREALLRFGNPTSTREHVAASDTALGLAGFSRDLRYAARQLRRSPGFAITAILTLALGIGANVVVFGVLNAIILRPLNIPHADRLVQIEQQKSGDTSESYPDYLDFRARNTAFSDLAAYRINSAGMAAGGSAQHCWVYEVSGNYFDMLGVQPALGRLLHANDERGPNSAPYIVLTDAFWRTRFNANPDIVGAIVELDKHPFTIIGVTPRTFNGTELFFWPDFFIPMINEEQIEGYNFLIKRGNHGIYAIGMLKPGVTPRQATDNLIAVAHQLTRENPALDDGLGARLSKPGLLGDLLGGPTRPFLAVIMVLALLVLTAACANLAGIFAARSADRARELAIRLSIGSSRWRLLRQILTEATLISVLGGLAGTAFAVALLDAITRWQPISQYPIHVTVTPDISVFAIALILSIVSGILPGLLPARQIWKTDAMQAMKSGSTVPSGLLRRLSLRDLILGVQITLCALLVTASLVALRGMQRSLHAPIGLNPAGAMLATEDLHMAGYSDDSSFPVQRRMIDEASRIPGVTAVGTIDTIPLGGGSNDGDVYREDVTDLRPSNSTMDAQYFSISPGYLDAAETHVIAGRDFTWDDTATSPKAAIVNQNFAHRMFGNEPAVGRRFKMGDKTIYEIVGVVEDGKYGSLTEDQTAAMFFPLAQSHDADTVLVVRSQLSPPETASALNRMLSGIDSSLPIILRSWPDNMALVLFPARVATAALGVMGLLAAMLAVTGVFGMAAYSVSKRLRELGIRIALGAHRGQLVRAALSRPFIVLLAGSAAGLVLGVLASRLLAALVYEATSRDPLVLLGAVASMILIGLIATWIPARRALSINPAQLLRED